MKNFLKTKGHWVLVLATIIIFIGIRLGNITSIEGPEFYPDSKVYLSVAGKPITVENYWKARVPIVVPLVYKLLVGDVNIIPYFQTGLALFAWIMLALAASRFFAGILLRWLVITGVLIFGLSAEVYVFDFLIMSESISLSLMLLLIAAWMFYLVNENPDWRSTVFIIITGALWIFTRDTNTLLVLGLSGLILIYSVFFKSELHLKVISAVLIGLCLLSSNSGSASERWVPPNIKVIEQRILTNEENLEFYLEHGMPLNQTMIEFAGRKEGSVFEWINNPEMTEFMQWHKEHGKSVYYKFLLQDPVKLFFDPIIKLRFLVNSNPIFYYDPRGFEPIFPESLSQIIFFQFLNARTITYSVICMLAGAIIFFLKKTKSLITPLVLGFLLYPHALIVWTASGGDVSRHAYQFRIQLRLTMILLLIFILGILLEWLVSKNFARLQKFKPIMLGVGIFISLVGLTSDFLFKTGDNFSLGFAQIFLLFAGVLLILGSITLHYAPEKLRTAIIGNDNV